MLLFNIDVRKPVKVNINIVICHWKYFIEQFFFALWSNGILGEGTKGTSSDRMWVTDTSTVNAVVNTKLLKGPYKS